MAEKSCVAYGFWRSPITPSQVAAQTPLADVQWDSDGRSLVWLERRSDRGVLVCQMDDDAPFDVTDTHSVRGTVGYGGGDFTVSHGFVVYAEKSGQLFRQPLEPGVPFPLTPAFGAAASPVLSDDGQWILYVHTCEGKETIAIVDSQGLHWPIDLITGADFYMQPVWHPAGDRVAWVEWDHPDMPWDGGRLMVAHLDGTPPTIIEKTCIAGGTEQPVFQPAFSPDGNYLSYIDSDGEWDRLITLDLASGQKRILVSGCVLTEPAWSQGIRVYGWSQDSSSIFFHRNDQGFGSLWEVGMESGTQRQLNVGPYTWFSQIAVSLTEDAIALIASSSTIPDRIVTFRGDQQTVRRRSRSERISLSELPEPSAFSWISPDGMTIHGLLYLPTSGAFVGSGKPPALINIHGGPTSQRVATFSADVAFFTSRGFAVLEVNYRGSTGYGRSYMTALREHWGVYDTEDAVGAAQALIDQNVADPNRLVIKGGSAGGYTVLNALIHHPGVFKAGICLYGVTNLFALASDTHKFEERYMDSLVGLLPANGERYQAWSPAFHADRIRDPVAVFQGSDDKVVPPDQAEAIVKVLQRNGTPHLYHLFEGEGHGWRKTETIRNYYEKVERFLTQYVLIG